MADVNPRDQVPVRADLWPHPLTADGRVRAEAWVPDAGATLLDVLSQLGPPPHGPLIVTVNGLPVPATRWERHRVFPGDLVLCRARLQGGDTNPLQIVLMIGVLALGGWAGAAIGGVAGSLVAGAIVTVGGLLVNALFPPALPDAPDKPKPIYTLTGGANRARPYDPVLMVLGQHRVFPDLAGAHYVEFVGGEQYLHQVFDFGVGDLDITDIRIGDTPLGAYNRTAAAADDTVEHTVPEFYGRTIYTQWRGNSAANALADVEQQLALPGEPITLVAEDVDTVTGAQLDDTNWHMRTSSLNASKLGLDIVANVLRFSKKGKLKSHTVNLTVQYREKGASAWTTLADPDTVIINGNQDPVRLTWFITPADAGKQWEVRVKRDTAKDSSTRIRDEVTWSALRTYQASTANAEGRTRLALRIKATGQLNGRLDRLSALVSARVKTWDKTKKTWSAANAPTSNPGDILRQFAEGIKDSAGRLIAGAGLSLANRIDLASIQPWREWCHTQGLKFNYVADGPVGLEEMLQLITRAGRASHSWHSGKLGVVYDQANRTPTTLITAGNILAGSLRVEWADGRLADEIVAEYTDPDFDWQPVALRRKVTGVTHPQRSARIRLPGVTDRAQAIEETNLHAARQEFHRRRLTWAMAMEGFSLLRGETVFLSEALVSGGKTGRLTGGAKAAPQLDAAVDISDGTDYLLLRLADGTLHTSVVTHPDGGTGETDTPSLTTALPGDPDQGGLAMAADAGVQARDVLWRYYSAANPPLKVKITGLRPLSDDTVEIQAIDEVAAYYAAKDLALTDPLPKLLSRAPKILAINVSETLIEAGAGYTVEIVVTLTVEGDWRGGVIWAQLDQQERRIVATLSAQETRGAWIEQAAGTLTITAVPGSDVAPTGQALTVTHTIGSDTVAPDEPEGVSAEGNPGGYILEWDASEETDYSHTEVRDGATSVNDAANATARGRASGIPFVRSDLDAVTTLKVWLRHVDLSGNKSGWVTVTVTTEELLAGQDGEDGAGVEYIFTSNATGRRITGSTNLPLASWNYDIPGLATGVTRGTQKYYDGTPLDLSATRPFLIRFRRPVDGSPAANANIGTVAWVQEASVRAHGQEGAEGASGIGYEEIFIGTSVGTVGSVQAPDNNWGYKQITGNSGWQITRAAANPNNNAALTILGSRREIQGSPSVGDAVSADWEDVFVVLYPQPGEGPGEAPLDSIGNLSPLVYPGDGYVQLFWDRNSGLRSLDSDIFKAGIRIRYREMGQGDDDWVVHSDGDGRGFSPEIISGLTNDTTYQFELSIGYRFPPALVLQFGDTFILQGTPTMRTAELLAEYEVTAGTWADDDGSPAYTGYFLANQDVYAGTPPDRAGGSLTVISAHPDTDFAPIGAITFDKREFGGGSTILRGFYFVAGGTSRGQGSDIYNDNRAFASIQIVGAADIELLRASASYNRDVSSSGGVLSSWSWAVDAVRFNLNATYRVRLLRTPAPEIGQVSLAFISGSTLYWVDPNNTLLAGLIRYKLRYRTSITSAWVDLDTDVTPGDGINTYDLSSITASTYEVGITPVSFQGDGPERIVASTDTGTILANVTRDARDTRISETSKTRMVRSTAALNRYSADDRLLSSAIVWISYRYFVVNAGALAGQSTLVFNSSGSEVCPLLGGARFTNSTRPSFSRGVLVIRRKAGNVGSSITLTVTIPFTPDDLVWRTIVSGHLGGSRPNTSTFRGWFLPTRNSAIARDSGTDSLRYASLLLI